MAAQQTTIQHTTGSQYTGELELGRMTGYGEYKFSTGTIYKGHFKDGMFHGEGQLIFPNGGTFTADWINGEAVTPDLGNGGIYTFQDGLTHEEPAWSYCHHKDRRFYTEICQGIKPAGCTQKTNNEHEEKSIPKGWYDTGDGFYNPENHVVYKYSTGTFLRHADLNEHEWIISTCRKGVSESDQLGPNGLYQ